MSPPRGIPYVRPAQPHEFPQLVDLGCKAFRDDPLLTYFGCSVEGSEKETRSRSLETYLTYLIQSCWLIGGRIDVVCMPVTLGGHRGWEKIVAASLWLPPSKRISPWQVLTMLRAGIVSVTQGLGLEGTIRMGLEYPVACHGSWKRGYEAEEEKGSAEESWYLQSIFTDPEYQKRGMMTMLIHEVFKSAPSSIFTLEATTAEAREHFKNLGFELLDRPTFGGGSVCRSGLPAEGKAAIGVEVYSMVHWNRQRRHKC